MNRVRVIHGLGFGLCMDYIQLGLSMDYNNIIHGLPEPSPWITLPLAQR